MHTEWASRIRANSDDTQVQQFICRAFSKAVGNHGITTSVPHKNGHTFCSLRPFFFQCIGQRQVSRQGEYATQFFRMPQAGLQDDSTTLRETGKRKYSQPYRYHAAFPVESVFQFQTARLESPFHLAESGSRQK